MLCIANANINANAIDGIHTISTYPLVSLLILSMVCQPFPIIETCGLSTNRLINDIISFILSIVFISFPESPDFLEVDNDVIMTSL